MSVQDTYSISVAVAESRDVERLAWLATRSSTQGNYDVSGLGGNASRLGVAVLLRLLIDHLQPNMSPRHPNLECL
jgi:hypothetical protein